MTRRAPLAAAALALAALLPALAPAPAAAQDGRDLARISAYLNALDTAEGGFVQIAPDGETSDGRFYIDRPGRIRFEYTPPNPSLVVSDGTWVVVYDMRDCGKQTAPLSSTPLNLFLQERVDLRAEGAVSAIERQAGQMRVTAVNPSDPNGGSITLIFNDNPLELRQWIVTDPEGRNTTVALNEITRGVDINVAKFLPARIEMDECN
ncbi:Outer membrane lipoprotein-sorting protein [Albimonas donghaensis]|uniref:Outer membrane lipoprotein-sorting protein n=1 Tax=Albimonas donghaensis TaxID=356660 RepID=A0A1H2Z3Y2_9RHOB|nr:outer membrane lipoprotein carrier protein LolA [Albimonas donghaensis]SDX12031.1 Outer membrane lipoprotein-sorting protein [Albimonas donghaensis]